MHLSVVLGSAALRRAFAEPGQPTATAAARAHTAAPSAARVRHLKLGPRNSTRWGLHSTTCGSGDKDGPWVSCTACRCWLMSRLVVCRHRSGTLTALSCTTPLQLPRLPPPPTNTHTHMHTVRTRHPGQVQQHTRTRGPVAIPECKVPVACSFTKQPSCSTVVVAATRLVSCASMQCQRTFGCAYDLRIHPMLNLGACCACCSTSTSP
jgi:hypothetical protein